MPYTVHPIDITNDEQFDDDFLKISPNNKIPAIVDHDNGMTMMESGAILLYLAEKSGRLMPVDPMADVSNGRTRPDARPGPPFSPVQQGGERLRFK